MRSRRTRSASRSARREKESDDVRRRRAARPCGRRRRAAGRGAGSSARPSRPMRPRVSSSDLLERRDADLAQLRERSPPERPAQGSEAVEVEVVEDDERRRRLEACTSSSTKSAPFGDRALECGQRVLDLVGGGRRGGRSPRSPGGRPRERFPPACAQRERLVAVELRLVARPRPRAGSPAPPRRARCRRRAPRARPRRARSSPPRRRPRRACPARSAWSCIRKPFARRAAVDAQHVERRAGSDVEHVGDLVRDRLERRAHEVRARRASREPGRSGRARRVPVRRAEAGEGGHERRRPRSSRPSARAPRSRPRSRSARARRAATAGRRRRRGPRPRARNWRRRPGRHGGGRLQQPVGGGAGVARPTLTSTKRAGAVGRLRLARRRSSLPEERRLLVAGDPGERDARAEQLGLARRRPAEGTIRGSTSAVDAEERRAARRPSRASRGRASIVRDAFVTSVTCAAPPVSFQTSQESTVPKARLAAAASVRARIHSSFVAEKYGSGTRPVRSRIEVGGQLGAALGRAPVLPDDRRVHRRARCARSQTTVVSRWFVIPIAASSAGARSRPSRERLPRGRRARSAQISSGSCSTQPGLREVLRDLAVAAPDARASSSSTTRHVVPVVPWSIARITAQAPEEPLRRASTSIASTSSSARASRSSGSVPRTARQRSPASFAEATPASVSSKATTSAGASLRRAARTRAGSPPDAACRASTSSAVTIASSSRRSLPPRATGSISRAEGARDDRDRHARGRVAGRPRERAPSPSSRPRRARSARSAPPSSASSSGPSTSSQPPMIASSVFPASAPK